MPFEYRPAREKYVSLVVDEMIPAVSREKLAEWCDVFCEEGVFTPEESQRILEVFAHRIGAELERVAAHAELKQLTASLEARVAARTSELGELNRQLEAFSYSVSHDLRAPVRAVAAFSDLLLDEHGGALDPAAASYVQRIRAAATHMNDLIEGLLELARVSHSTLAQRTRSTSAEEWS